MGKWRIRVLKNGKFTVTYPEGHEVFPFDAISDAMFFIRRVTKDLSDWRSWADQQ